MSNGGGLKITKKCKIPGYKYLVWFSKKAITNIICLNNLIKSYQVTYDNDLDTTFVVHCSAFGFIRSSTMSLTTLILCQIVLKCMI